MLSLAIALCVIEPLATEAMGRVVMIEGAATVRPKSTDAWAPIEKGVTLNTGDTVKTGSDARLRILMANRSVVDLGANSEMRFKFISGPPARRRVGLRAILGRLWARVARGAGEDRFEIETDNAVAGVRGTSFFVEVGAQGDTTVTVSAGSVEMAGLDIEPFMLGALQRTIMRRGAKPLIERNLAAHHIARLRASVRPRHRLGGRNVARRLAGLQNRIRSGKGLPKGLSGAKAKKIARKLARSGGLKRMLLNLDPSVARRLLERIKRRRLLLEGG